MNLIIREKDTDTCDDSELFRNLDALDSLEALCKTISEIINLNLERLGESISKYSDFTRISKRRMYALLEKESLPSRREMLVLTQDLYIDIGLRNKILHAYGYSLTPTELRAARKGYTLPVAKLRMINSEEF